MKGMKRVKEVSFQEGESSPKKMKKIKKAKEENKINVQQISPKKKNKKAKSEANSEELQNSPKKLKMKVKKEKEVQHEEQNGDSPKPKSQGKNKKRKLGKKKEGGPKNPKLQEKPQVKTPDPEMINLKDQSDLMDIQEKRMTKRDSRTLFIGKNKSSNEVIAKSLTGVVDIRKIRSDLTFVMFKDREAAKCAYGLIKEDNVLGENCKVDFVGTKSKLHPPVKTGPCMVHQRCLFIRDIPNDASVEEVKEQLTKEFANVEKLIFRKKTKTPMGNFALLKFNTAEDAKNAFLSSNNFQVKGSSVTVLYSTQSSEKIKNRRNSNKKKPKKNRRKGKGPEQADKKPKKVQDSDEAGSPAKKPKVLLAKKKKPKTAKMEKSDKLEMKDKKPKVLLAKKKKQKKMVDSV